MAIMVLCAMQTQAAWRIAVESKSVGVGETGVTIGVQVAWDLPLIIVTVPLVARQTSGGAFWSGALPYDTTTAALGVTWNASVVSWASFIREMRPGPGCAVPGQPYDGVSPDYFVINAMGLNGLPAQPAGISFVTFQFNVNSFLGQFEFDTACFTFPQLRKVFMVSGGCPVDHGPPPGTNEAVFQKGVVTIAPCNCGPLWCDLDTNGVLNPADAVQIVNYVYHAPLDFRERIPGCPYTQTPNYNGDWNCDGGINPVDVVWYVNYIYKMLTEYPPCNPCDCTTYPPVGSGDCPPWP
jgi:hypothetical protein